MRHNFNLLDINLHLFDGAAGAAGEGAGEAAQSDAGALPKAETNRGNGSSRRSRSGAYDNVVFGKQEDVPAADDNTSSDAGENKSQGKANKSGVDTTSDTLEAKRKAFKELVEGEYKDQYTEMFQQSFDRRFKETKGMEKSLSDQKPIIDMLMQRYNIGDGDMAKLQTALEQDNRYYEEAAEEAGMSVEQFKAMQKLERENAELKAYRQKQAADQQAQQQMNAWFTEAEKLKAVYPSFDFRTELGNREFMGMLKAGVNMQKAYEAMHHSELAESAARAAAETAGQQMAARIQNKASRPKENGTSSQSAVIVKSDVHSLTREDRAEAVRQAMRGKKISF